VTEAVGLVVDVGTADDEVANGVESSSSSLQSSSSPSSVGVGEGDEEEVDGVGSSSSSQSSSSPSSVEVGAAEDDVDEGVGPSSSSSQSSSSVGVAVAEAEVAVEVTLAVSEGLVHMAGRDETDWFFYTGGQTTALKHSPRTVITLSGWQQASKNAVLCCFAQPSALYRAL
jgi:hypothetical protein